MRIALASVAGRYRAQRGAGNGADDCALFPIPGIGHGGADQRAGHRPGKNGSARWLHGDDLLPIIARHRATRRIETGLLRGPVEALEAIAILLLGGLAALRVEDSTWKDAPAVRGEAAAARDLLAGAVAQAVSIVAETRAARVFVFMRHEPTHRALNAP